MDDRTGHVTPESQHQGQPPSPSARRRSRTPTRVLNSAIRTIY